MARLVDLFVHSSMIVLWSSCSITLDGDLGKEELCLSDSENKYSHVFDNKIPLYEDTTSFLAIQSVSYWMEQINGEKSSQGADCYGNMLCQFRVDHTSLDIMDLKQKRHVATIPLFSLGSAFHCNNADFSSSFYDDSDEFPLLYSSHQGNDARCILVDRIYKVGKEYKFKTLQRIDIPYGLDEPLQFTPDAIIDNENQYLYVYTGNTKPITSFYIYRFRLPRFAEGSITLTEKDFEAAWIITDNPPKYKQGGMVKDGIIYLVEGVPGWETDNIIRAIDLHTGSYSIINLTKSFNAKWEPEDIFWYDGNFYIAANRSGIYRLDEKDISD